MNKNPGDRGVWSIGDPLNPSRDDAMSGTEGAARANAKALSNNERIVAVWNGDQCVALYWGGNEWRQN